MSLAKKPHRKIIYENHTKTKKTSYYKILQHRTNYTRRLHKLQNLEHCFNTQEHTDSQAPPFRATGRKSTVSFPLFLAFFWFSSPCASSTCSAARGGGVRRLPHRNHPSPPSTICFIKIRSRLPRYSVSSESSHSEERRFLPERAFRDTA